MMKPFSKFHTIALTLYFLGARAQFTYGENQRGTIRDNEVVSAAFPDVEGVELLSPAFTRLDSLPSGWSYGTDGPTDDAELGKQLSL